MSNEAIEIDDKPGARLYDTIASAIAMSEKTGRVVWFVHNGIKINVRHTDDPDLILQHWNAATLLNKNEIGVEPYREFSVIEQQMIKERQNQHYGY